MESTLQRLGLQELKQELVILKAKGWNDAVRLLDLFEVTGGKPGALCTMQVMIYTTGEWQDCEVNGKGAYSLAHWNKVIRGELGWDGSIRLAVAAK